MEAKKKKKKKEKKKRKKKKKGEKNISEYFRYILFHTIVVQSS